MITRKIINNNFFYYKNNNKILSKKIINRINKLKIPPAYTNVEISEDPNKKIQATGYDSKLRKQYIYNHQFSEDQKEIKFCELINFGKKITKIRRDIKLNVNKKTISKEVLIYLILYLVDNCNFRIGSKKYKKLYDTYGVTTLNTSHIFFLKNYIKIKFVGKKNIINESIIKNKNIIELLKILCKINDKQEFIFCYQENNNIYSITDKSINKFLQKKYNKSITVKMFRTWNANHILLKELIYNRPNDKDIPKIIKKVSNKLHNTPSVSKKNYINNELIKLYLHNKNIFFNLLLQYKKKRDMPSIDKVLNYYLNYLCRIENYKLKSLKN